MAENIEARVIAAIVKSQNLDPASLKPEAKFEDLGMTSLDALALITDLEEEFNISIPDSDAMGLSTVGGAVECVRKLVPANSNGTGAEAEVPGL